MKYKFGLVLVIFLLVSFVSANKAFAVSGTCYFTSTAGPIGSTGNCSEAGLGAYGTNDIFSGRTSSTTNAIIYDSVKTPSTAKSDLINFITNQYNNGSTQNKIGAGFLVANLLGQRHWPSADDVSKFNRIMAQSDVSVTLDSSETVGDTSWYDNDKKNTFFGHHPNANRQVIRIKQDGHQIAEIERSCGNLVANPGIIKEHTPGNTVPVAHVSVTGIGYTQGDLTMRNPAADGVAFYHTLSTSSYNGVPTQVSWQIFQYNGGAYCDRYNVNWGGAIASGSNSINANGSVDARAGTGARFNPRTDRYVCQLIVVTNVTNGGGGGGTYSIARAHIPANPATITPSSTAVSGQIDAQNGNAAFYHDIIVSNYGYIDHNISYTIEQFESTAKDCSSGGTWRLIASGTKFVNANGAYRVYGPTNSSFNRNTIQQVCQRLNITAWNPAANGGGSSVASTGAVDGTITLGATFSPSDSVSPGESVTITPSVVARADSGNSFPMTYTIRYGLTTPVPGLNVSANNYDSPTINVTSTESNFSHPVTLAIPGAAVDYAGAKICVNVTSTNPTLSRYFTGGSSSTGDLCIIIANKPVFSVRGGDVVAGASTTNPLSGECVASSDAKIGGWNSGNVNSYDYMHGAGTELAAFANGMITGFATARSATPVLRPSGLAFANNGSYTGDNYGGGFDALPCISNYWVDHSAVTETTAPGTGTSGLRKMTGNQTVGNISVSPGIKQIVYVDGNLTINNNITYVGRNTWSSLDQIPALMFVVSGDINISPNVTEINGIYAAKGDITTCSGGAPGNSLYGTCNANELTIKGAFITSGSGKKIILNRTQGTSYTSQAGNPGTGFAEKFLFLPEIWLAQWPAVSGGSSQTYDSITALPPVL